MTKGFKNISVKSLSVLVLLLNFVVANCSAMPDMNNENSELSSKSHTSDKHVLLNEDHFQEVRKALESFYSPNISLQLPSLYADDIQFTSPISTTYGRATLLEVSNGIRALMNSTHTTGNIKIDDMHFIDPEKSVIHVDWINRVCSKSLLGKCKDVLGSSLLTFNEQGAIAKQLDKWDANPFSFGGTST